MNKKDHHQENQTTKTATLESAQIPLLKDVVDLLVEHDRDGGRTVSNPKRARGLSKPATKKVISRGPVEDPHYDPDTLDLF